MKKNQKQKISLHCPFKDRLRSYCLWSLIGSLPILVQYRKPGKWSQFGSGPASSCYKLRALYFLRLYMCYLQEFASKLLTHTTHIVHITGVFTLHILYMFYMRCIHLIHAHRPPHEENKSRIIHPDFLKRRILYVHSY
jgi:hypothetical protein